MANSKKVVKDERKKAVETHKELPPVKVETKDLEKELRRSIAGLKATITERNKRIAKLEKDLEEVCKTNVFLENQLTQAVEANEAKDKEILRLKKRSFLQRIFG